MNRSVALVVFLAIRISMFAQAVAPPERFSVEYITGHAGGKAHSKGSLTIGADALRFDDDYYQKKTPQQTKTLFVIPLSTIAAAAASTERENYFGAFSANAVRNQDYVTIRTETGQGAEAIVFKAGEKQAVGIVAKIEFAAKKAKEP